MNKRYELIDKIIEIEIYLYIVFMFITKGEGIRNTLLFSAFFLWLSTIKYRRNNWILKEPVSFFFWGVIVTILISSVLSIDPAYSLTTLRDEPLKSVLIFTLISTTLSDESRLRRFLFIALLILVFIVSTGFYSFFTFDKPTMYTNTYFRHANPNRLAVDLGVILSFLFVLFLITGKSAFKKIVLISIVTGILALMLTGSRGGNIAFLFIMLTWLGYFLKKKTVSPKKVFLWGILILTALWTTTFFMFPGVTKKFMKLPKQTVDFHGRREEIWEPLLCAAQEKPFLGWGYGSDIFSMDTPFKNTPYQIAPVNIHESHRNPHNAFLRVLFHQGIIGLLAYIALLIAALAGLWRDANRSNGFRSYMLIACFGIIFGIFIIDAIVENSHLMYLSFVLGIGLAARYMKDDPLCSKTVKDSISQH